jgi:hypothetical protein
MLTEVTIYSDLNFFNSVCISANFEAQIKRSNLPQLASSNMIIVGVPHFSKEKVEPFNSEIFSPCAKRDIGDGHLITERYASVVVYVAL